MIAGNDQLRKDLNGKLQPPIDVLIDPSLLTASRSLNRLTKSTVFASQTQATLGRTPTEPRLGDLHIPTTFLELIEAEKQPTVQKTNLWNFYRGQAEAAFRDDIVDLIDQNNLLGWSGDAEFSNLGWSAALDDPARQDQLVNVLQEEISFLRSGGILLSRTPASFNAFRDAGVTTIDVGKAELVPELEEALSDIGYKDPATICGFAVSTADSTVDALSGNVLNESCNLLIYRFGR
ncbi:hypothetical protein [Halorubellus litoreus]|uniref:Uncharacterized protein n=1 Tax=Halorubellus litoreus TaxID=755308 RepID=A0ABD5VG57_9EURY